MKKTCKRLSALLLALVMVMSLLPMSALAARVENDAVAIAAPDDVTDAARPAAALDAEDPAGEEDPATPKYLGLKITDTTQGNQQHPHVKLLDFGKNTVDAADTPEDQDGIVDGAYEIDFRTFDEIPVQIGFLPRFKDEHHYIGVTADSGNNSGWTQHYATNGNGRTNTALTEATFAPLKVAANKAYTAYVQFKGDSVTFKVKEQGQEAWGAQETFTMSNYYAEAGGFAIRVRSRNGQSDSVLIEKISRYKFVDETTEISDQPDLVVDYRKDKTDETFVRWVDYMVYRNQNTDYTQRPDPEASARVELVRLETGTPDYTYVNIKNGYFDVGATVTPGQQGGWEVSYSNDDLITASAPSYQAESGDNSPAGAVDGNTGTCWHTNWGGGQGSEDMENDADNRYIQLDLATATKITALRYLPKNWVQYSNGIITRYDVKVCADDEVTEQSEWTSVATATDAINWDAAATSANGSGDNWYIAVFDEPVTTKHVRLYALTAKCNDDSRHDNNYVSAREIRLVAGDEFPNLTLSGTVTAESENLNGVKVELVQNNTDKTFATGYVPVLTNESGKYSLVINFLPAGTYHLRVSKDGYGAAINTADSIAIPTGGAIESIEGKDASLTAIETEQNKAKFKYDMSNEENQPKLGFQKAETVPTHEYTDGALVLKFPNTNRENNLVTLQGTNVKNGTIEFDAHREGTYGNPGRFGLALRLTDKYKWIYVGLGDSDTNWFHERWDGGSSHDDGWSSNTAGPSFKKGDTRHFKVTIKDENISLTIDGIPVFTNAHIGGDDRTGIPTEAKDVGFICGNSGWGVPSDITIDNVYIFREDQAYTVTKAEDSQDLTVKISNSAGDEDLGGDDLNEAGEGDVIKVSFPGQAQALDTLTVTEVLAGEGEARTITPTFVAGEPNEDGYFTFEMPAYNVTITGTKKAKLHHVTIDDNGGANLRVGKTLSATVWGTEAETDDGTKVTDKVNYKWYHGSTTGTDPEAWTPCYDGAATNASSEMGMQDEGKLVKIVVTPAEDNETYSSRYSVEARTSKVIAPAFVPATGVTFLRDAVEMWTNREDNGKANDEVEGNTTTLTATIDPVAVDPDGIRAQWFVEGLNGIVALTNQQINTPNAEAEDGATNVTATATVTASKGGSVIVHVVVLNDGDEPYDTLDEVKAADGVVTKSIPITVKTDAKTVTIDNGYSEETHLVLYANDTDKLTEIGGGRTNTAHVHATLTPADATETSLTWKYENVPDAVSSPTLEISKNNQSTEDAEEPEVSGDPDAAQLSDDPTDPTDPTAPGTPGETGPAQSSGEGLNITAVAEPTKVGLKKITVISDSNEDAYATFIVEVRRVLEPNISIGIAGGGTEPKVGTALSVNATFQMTDEGRSALKYQWKRGTNPTGEDATDIPGADKATYTPGADDVNNYITVVVTIDPAANCYYEIAENGGKTAITSKVVVKADSPAAPNLTVIDVLEENGKGSITITNPVEGATYEYRMKPAEGDWTDNWVEVKIGEGGDANAENTSNGGIKINGLDAGNYQVRIKETPTTKAGTWRNATIADFEETLYDIVVNITQGSDGLNHGSVTRDPARAKVGDTVTITVTPDAGYKLKGELKLTATTPKDGGDPGEEEEVEAPELKQDTGNPNLYTFTMTAAKVTVNAEFEPIMVKIYHDLSAGLTCDVDTEPKEGEDGSHYHEIPYSTKEFVIKLTVAAGYNIPTEFTVTKVGGAELGSDAVTFGTGKSAEGLDQLIITFPHGVTEDIKVTAKATQRTYAVNTLKQTNYSRLELNGPASVNHGATYTATLTVKQEFLNVGWKLPETIQVQMGTQKLGTDVIEGAAYYTYSNGQIKVYNVTGILTITATAAQTALTSVAISGAPQSGTTLRMGAIDPSKASAYVTYEWLVGDTAEAAKTAETASGTNATFALTDALTGKYIALRVTGTGTTNETSPFIGTVTSEAIGPVKAQVFPATGITLNKSSLTMTYGDEPETLIATVTPANVTDPTVTWKSDNEKVVTVDGGVVTIVGVGNAKITATDSAGHEAECSVNVKAAEITVEFIGTAKVGQKLEIRITPESAISSTIITWSKRQDGATNGSIIEALNDELEYTPVAADVGYYISAAAFAFGNYSGGGSRESAAPVAPNTSALEEAIEAAKALTEADYTAESWAAFKDVLDYAEGVLQNAKTQEAMDEAAKALTDAMEALVDAEDPTPEVNYDALNAAITKAEGLTAANYTEDSWAKVAEALEAANAIKNKADATQEEVNGAAKTLNDAMDNLVEKSGKKVDTTALDAAIAEAEGLTEADYTAESWAALQTALEAAKETKQNANATQDDVDEATEALTDAIAALEEKGEEPVVTYTITVNDSENGSVSADKTAAAEGATVTLTATPDAGYELSNVTVTDENGNTVTVTEDNTFVMPAANVTVNATFTKIVVTGVTVDKSAKVSIGGSKKLTATILPEGAIGTLTWTSGNEEVATVDQDGTVHGVAEGTATITVTVDGTYSATCEVTVSNVKNPVRPSTPSPSTSEDPEGPKETVETKPDGTVVETVENPDGSKEIVETKPDGTVIDTVVAADGATTEKVTDPEGDVTITVTDETGEVLAKVELPAATPDPEEVFIDLDPTPWAEDAINHMAGLGLVKGVGGHKYDPIDSMTRGALATVLHRLSQGKTDYTVTFTDVAMGQYYTEGVAWAARVNVVTGYSEDIFAPDDAITREQLAVMLARYAKLIGMDTTADTAALDQFVDGANTGDWAVDGMAWCVEQGILQGKGADNLDPTAKITRAEVAIMLDRFIALIK